MRNSVASYGWLSVSTSKQQVRGRRSVKVIMAWNMWGSNHLTLLRSFTFRATMESLNFSPQLILTLAPFSVRPSLQVISRPSPPYGTCSALLNLFLAPKFVLLFQTNTWFLLTSPWFHKTFQHRHSLFVGLCKLPLPPHFCTVIVTVAIGWECLSGTKPVKVSFRFLWVLDVARQEWQENVK